MAVIRAFIAIDLPDTIQRALGEVIDQLQAQLPSGTVRWVTSGNIHLTLKFLGEVSSRNLDLLNNVLRSQAGRQLCFEVTVGGLNAFPSIHRPRVIWIGVQAPQTLFTLQHTIETETRRLGYAAEQRPFSAHLTLGRVSHNAPPESISCLGEILKSTEVGTLGTTRVESVCLFHSDLQPGGAVYSTLFSAALAPAA